MKIVRLAQFLKLPFGAKLLVLRRKLGLSQYIPLLVRLPDIGWWIADPRYRSELNDWVWNYEIRERRFLVRWLRKGMNVLDIGAHVGFYTLLAARCVYPSGLVIAFEPSPRERKYLFRHLRLNRCHNVLVEPFALSNTEGEAEFFLYPITVSNSLRPRRIDLPTRSIRVPVTTIDTYLERKGLKHVDFIKIDAEGAELSILQGARRLLNNDSPPFIMCELHDRSTKDWGYSARLIYEFLIKQGYKCFEFSEQGTLVPALPKYEYYAENLFAVPQERLSEVNDFIEER